MKTSGWIMLAVSWALIIISLGFCLYRTFFTPSETRNKNDNNEVNANGKQEPE